MSLEEIGVTPTERTRLETSAHREFLRERLAPEFGHDWEPLESETPPPGTRCLSNGRFLTRGHLLRERTSGHLVWVGDGEAFKYCRVHVASPPRRR